LTREKALLVGVVTRGTSRNEVERHLDELERLADTAGAEVVGRDVRERASIDAATFIGSGAVGEISANASALDADLVIFDDDLAPGQVRNLEKSMPRVTDRAGLILEIFNRHARTREARTQVQLASYEYLLPRLTGKYKGLSRLGGGIGGRGAGEQQLELDRRKIRHRISLLKKDLVKIETSRRVQKRGRRGSFQVAIAGYTNAGKTTLFNRLTEDTALAADRLFATLDARVGKIRGTDILVVDTVGLIRKLPPGLVASFRSTLAEIRDADLVIHAIDGASDWAEEEKRVAEETFEDLHVDPEKVLSVYTKADLSPRHRRHGIWISATTGEGIDRLLAEVESRRSPDELEMAVRIPYAESREIARARARATVHSESDEGDALVLRLSIPRRYSESLEPYQIER
jgi:GTP-binding protein HflX